jgi:hypothetical protein
MYDFDKAVRTYKRGKVHSSSASLQTGRNMSSRSNVKRSQGNLTQIRQPGKYNNELSGKQSIGEAAGKLDRLSTAGSMSSGIFDMFS